MKRATTSILLAVAGLALAGCGDNGFGVNLTVTADSSVSDATLGAIRSLSMSVSGAETYATTYPLSEAMGRTVRLVYRPGVSSGTLSFALTANDGSGTAVAFGHVDGVALKAGGSVAATLTLSGGAPPPGDGGACSGVTQCMAGDGCCPSGCDQTTDADCTAVCGNGVVEAGETCDDGNTMNGDGCDPTCQLGNAVSTLSGAAGGQGYFDSAMGSLARFASLSGLATDGTLVYFADNQTIRSVSIATGATATIAGAAGASGNVDGVGADARFSFIRDVEFLGGALYILDNGSLRKLVLATKTVTTLALKDTGMNPLSFSSPADLASDGTSIAVLDGGNNLFLVNVSTLVATNLNGATGIGTVGTACQDVAFLSPNFYIACRNNVVKVPAAGGAPTNVIGTAPSGTCTPGPTNLCAGFGLAAVPSQNALYVTDANSLIRQVATVTTTPALNNYAGSTPGYTNSTTLGAAQFRFAGNVHLVAVGTTLVVLDDQNFALRSVATTGTGTLAGLPPSASAVGATGADSRYSPGALHAVTSDGSSLYFAENPPIPGIRKVSLANGGSVSVFDYNPSGLTVVGGQLYLSIGDGTIRRIPTDGSVTTFSSTMPFAGVVGTTAPPKDGAIATAQLSSGALTNDGTNVYFVDPVNKQVRKLDVAAGMVSTLAGSPGTRDVLDGTGAAAHFRAPTDITTDGTSLYVLDGQFGPGATVVRKVDIATGKVTTIAGTPDDISGVDGTGAAATFAGARGLATNGTALFITDAGHSWQNSLGLPGPDANGGTIRELVLATGAVTTLAGARGQYTTLDGVGVNARFSAPAPIVFDQTAKALYLFDGNEGVIRQIK